MTLLCIFRATFSTGFVGSAYWSRLESPIPDYPLPFGVAYQPYLATFR
ncbi:hypothetical protein ACWATR_34545 [Nostoc sp. UIC 10890]